MTPEQIHDALTLLPSDLITEADKLRNPRKKPIRFRGWVATAACAALVLMIGSFAARNLLPDMAKSTESIMGEPAAAPMDIPAEMQMESALDSVTADAETAAAIPEEAAPDSSHRHVYDESPAGEISTAATGGAYCGNTKTTVTVGGESFDLYGSDSIAITRILENLDFDPDKVCRCIAPITVDTELTAGIEVNLAEGFARCEEGQADLTKEQSEIIQSIIDRLEIVDSE